MKLNIYVAQAGDGGWPAEPELTAERLPVPRTGEHIALPGDRRAFATIVAVDWHLAGPAPCVNVLAYHDEAYTPLPGLITITDQDAREILSGLEDAADYRRDQGEQCTDCTAAPEGQKCRDHDTDDAVASMYDMLHQALAAKLGEDVAADEISHD